MFGLTNIRVVEALLRFHVKSLRHTFLCTVQLVEQVQKDCSQVIIGLIYLERRVVVLT